MKAIHAKIAKIVVGSALTIFATIVLYRAISFDVVQSRGHSYSLADSPVSFYFMIGLHILIVVTGLFLVRQGWRDSGR